MLPVFIDLETRSACDLRAEGGHRYAQHPTTNLLTAAWTADAGESYHVWMPGVLEGEVRQSLLDLHLKDYTVHYGPEVPEALKLVADRPWVGHNAWTFDRWVWKALTPADCQPVAWIDTYPLALAAGLPGGLNAIGKSLWGEGKYEAGNKAMKDASRVKAKGGKKKGKAAEAAWAPEPADCKARNVPVASAVMVARYNVQDVRLMVDLVPVLAEQCVLPEAERAVLAFHDSCNSRGVRVDLRFVRQLITLADESKGHAIAEIAHLTGGALADQVALQSRVRVMDWVRSQGVEWGESLRRDVVTRFIEANRDAGKEEAPGGDEEEEGVSDEEAPRAPEEEEEAPIGSTKNLALVVRVLELRMAALRVTQGKLQAAVNRTGLDGRLRDWAAYWAAHTGRFAGRGLQPHNFPRPKEGVDTWEMCGLADLAARKQPDVGPPVLFDYEQVRGRLPLEAKGADGSLLYPYLSVDDVSSALLRMSLVPDDDQSVLFAADLANIEARVLAHLAGETELMKLFWEGGDPYMKMATVIFGPPDKWPQYTDPATGKLMPLKKHPYRQTGKVIELGSGYRLGETQMAVYCAAMGIDLEKVGTNPRACVLGYRRSHPAIAGEEREYKGRVYFRGGYWDQIEEAALNAARDGGCYSVGGVSFVREGDSLACVLRSGRRIVYRGVSVRTARVFERDRDQLWYTSPRFGPVPTHGGKLVENIVQGDSRDVLVHGAVLCERAGVPWVLHVHDEGVASRRADGPAVVYKFDKFMSCITTCPDWLTNFPLDAEGSFAVRYAKSPGPDWKAQYGKDEWVYRNGSRLK